MKARQNYSPTWDELLTKKKEEMGGGGNESIVEGKKIKFGRSRNLRG